MNQLITLGDLNPEHFEVLDGQVTSKQASSAHKQVTVSDILNFDDEEIKRLSFLKSIQTAINTAKNEGNRFYTASINKLNNVAGYKEAFYNQDINIIRDSINRNASIFLSTNEETGLLGYSVYNSSLGNIENDVSSVAIINNLIDLGLVNSVSYSYGSLSQANYIKYFVPQSKLNAKNPQGSTVAIAANSNETFYFGETLDNPIGTTFGEGVEGFKFCLTELNPLCSALYITVTPTSGRYSNATKINTGGFILRPTERYIDSAFFYDKNINSFTDRNICYHIYKEQFDDSDRIDISIKAIDVTTNEVIGYRKLITNLQHVGLDVRFTIRGDVNLNGMKFCDENGNLFSE